MSSLSLRRTAARVKMQKINKIRSTPTRSTLRMLCAISQGIMMSTPPPRLSSITRASDRSKDDTSAVERDFQTLRPSSTSTPTPPSRRRSGKTEMETKPSLLPERITLRVEDLTSITFSLEKRTMPHPSARKRTRCASALELSIKVT